MWAERDSNPHSLRNQFLKLACIPFHHLPDICLPLPAFGGNFTTSAYKLLLYMSLALGPNIRSK